MRKSAMVRKTDNLGRITIPMEMRNTLGIKPYERKEFEIIPKDGGIFIRPYEQVKKCSCCEAERNVMFELNGIKLCEECVEDFREGLTE